MKKVELRTMEQTKYEIIKNLVDNNVTNAVLLLNLESL